MNIAGLSSLALDIIGMCLYRLEQPPASVVPLAQRYDARGVLIEPEPVVSKVAGRITSTAKDGGMSPDRGAVYTGSAKFVSKKRIVIPGDANNQADRLPIIQDNDGTRYRLHAPSRKGCVYVYPLERYYPAKC